jgi:uncharacterized phiE125 gp8 family phage protein
MTAGPAAEPISLAEAKAHLRVDADDEDALLGSLIVAARAFVEKILARALITQEWSLYLDAWPRGGTIMLPIGPVQDVAAVRVYDPDDMPAELDEEAYSVDALSEPARLILSASGVQLLPARLLNAYEIAFAAGRRRGLGRAGANSAGHQTARRALVRASRAVVLGEAPQEVPATIASLLSPYRRVRL